MKHLSSLCLEEDFSLTSSKFNNLKYMKWRPPLWCAYHVLTSSNFHCLNWSNVVKLSSSSYKSATRLASHLSSLPYTIFKANETRTIAKISCDLALSYRGKFRCCMKVPALCLVTRINEPEKNALCFVPQLYYFKVINKRTRMVYGDKHWMKLTVDWIQCEGFWLYNWIVQDKWKQTEVIF